MSKFGVILADPPWTYHRWSQKASRTADAHYAVQSGEWIKSLPVALVAAPDCAVFLWVTYPTLPLGLEIITAWGFEYKTCAFTWIKTCQEQSDKPRFGLGYWTRSNAEICLLATRGNPKPLNKDVGQVIACPIAQHSEKPVEVYERIERLVAGPYLEMFARPRGGLFPLRDGWTQIGNEITGRDIKEDLCLLANEEEGS